MESIIKISIQLEKLGKH